MIPPKSEGGFALVEVLLALAILTIAVGAYVSALSTSSIAIRKADRRNTAEILARSQLEHTKAQAFAIAPTSYPSMASVPTGYSVLSTAVSVTGRDDNIQEVTVIVQFQGNQVLTLTDYKLNR